MRTTGVIALIALVVIFSGCIWMWDSAVRATETLEIRAASTSRRWASLAPAVFGILGQVRRARPKRLPWAISLQRNFGRNPLSTIIVAAASRVSARTMQRKSKIAVMIAVTIQKERSYLLGNGAH